MKVNDNLVPKARQTPGMAYLQNRMKMMRKGAGLALAVPDTGNDTARK